jgi:plasmid maintenance system antidote protein VapI
VARDIGVPPNQITGVLHGTRGITADTALRFGRYFGTTLGFG